MVCHRFPPMKPGRGRHWWAQGYYVSPVGVAKDVIRKYIEQQEEAGEITSESVTSIMP